MKKNITHFLFDKIWSTTRDLVPDEIAIVSGFTEAEIEDNKYEDLFPEVSLSTVALVSSKLAESGIIIPLQNFSNFNLKSAIERSIVLFTIDLATIPENYTSTHISNEEPVIDAKDIKFKFRNWSEVDALVKSTETLENKTAILAEEYPDSLVFSKYQPWRDILEKAQKSKLITQDNEELAKNLFIKFIKERSDEIEVSFQDAFHSIMDDYKVSLVKELLGDSIDNIKVGVNKNIVLYADIQPVDFNEYSQEEAAECLNVYEEFWITETNDLIMTAVCLECENKETFGCTTRLQGDFFVFPNDPSDIRRISINDPMYIIPLHRLADHDIDDILGAISQCS